METYGEIDEKPLKNDTVRNISKFEQKINRIFCFNFIFN